jgi:hypothetical protein
MTRMKQAGRKDVNVAIPEPGSDEFARAVDYLGFIRDSHRRPRTDGAYHFAVNQNDGVVDWRRIWRWVNGATDERQVSGFEGGSAKEKK